MFRNFTAPVDRSSNFKLLKFFITGSLVAFVVVALLLGWIFRALAMEGLIRGYEADHASFAQIVANDMWQQDIVPLLRLAPGRTPAEMQNSAEVAELHRKVTRLLRGTKVFRIKVYSRDAVTVYASDGKDIGRVRSDNAGVMRGLSGFVSSELQHRNQFSTFEGEVQNRDVIETYIPRYDHTNRVEGVFEIYGDATTTLADIAAQERYLVGAVIGLLTLLYLVLFAIVHRAQDILQQQSRARAVAQEALARSEERWKFALEGAGDGVWDADLASGNIFYSARYKAMYGYDSDEELEGCNDWSARVHPDDVTQVLVDRDAYFSGRAPTYVSERRMRRKDGSWMWVLSRGMAVSYDQQGKPLRMLGIHTDISERHAREEQLRLADTVFQTVDEAVTVTDANNRIVSVNPGFTAITGYEPHEVLGKTPSLLASGVHAPAFYAEMWRCLDQRGSWRGEIHNRHKSGRLYVEWLSIKRVADPQGRVSHYVAVFTDITERKASEERMQQLAHFDVLTGLANRALFGDRLRQGLAQARRDQGTVALMFVDLDKFKPVNDTLGHAVGDLVLKEVARRLAAGLHRATDTVARLGGDEFVVMLPEVERFADVLALAEHLCTALQCPYQAGPHSLDLSACIGVAAYPMHATDEGDLLKAADAAMYQAKQRGGASVGVAPPLPLGAGGALPAPELLSKL